MKICINCGRDFDISLKYGDGSMCPTSGCDGTILDLDENIYETILTLNGKGYRTRESCSGHTYKNKKIAYLLLHPLVNPRIFQTLPSKFVQDPKNPWKITRAISAKDTLQQLKEIGEAAYDLLEWAEGVPDPADILAKFEHSVPNDYSFINKINPKFKLHYKSHYPFNGNYIYIFRTIVPSSLADLCKDEINILAKLEGITGSADVYEFEF